jgi:hypothetical protein
VRLLPLLNAVMNHVTDLDRHRSLQASLDQPHCHPRSQPGQPVSHSWLLAGTIPIAALIIRDPASR